MTASIRKIGLTMPKGHEAMGPVLRTLIEYIDKLDIRSDGTSFREDLIHDGQVKIGGRAQIGGGAKITTQRVLPTVTTGGRLSVQNVQPLSALSGSTTIDIAAHTVQFGFGTVAYNGGTLVGLAADTLYYVYGDDDDLQGGAMSYFATTTPQDIAAVNGRYFVGSIRTPPTADARTIVAATRANPCVLTLSAGTWSTGNQITIAGCAGMVELNGQTPTITFVSGNDFRLDGVDSTLYGVYTASSGTATRNANNQTGSGGAAAGGGGKPVFLGSGF